MVELRVEIHESVKQDSQAALNAIMRRLDEERVEKIDWKQKCDQLTSVLLKVTQSSQEVEPIVSSIDTEALKKVEWVGIKGRVVDKWTDHLKSEGSLLLDSTVSY